MKIGYKAVKQDVRGDHVVRILKLQILGEVVKPQSYDRKLGKRRTSKVRVLAVYSKRRAPGYNFRLDKELTTKGPYLPYHVGSSFTTPDFEYHVGKVAEAADGLNRDRYKPCAAGINYFNTVQEAINYFNTVQEDLYYNI